MRYEEHNQYGGNGKGPFANLGALVGNLALWKDTALHVDLQRSWVQILLEKYAWFKESTLRGINRTITDCKLLTNQKDPWYIINAKSS